jgi:hypothetical protein
MRGIGTVCDGLLLVRRERIEIDGVCASRKECGPEMKGVKYWVRKHPALRELGTWRNNKLEIARK